MVHTLHYRCPLDIFGAENANMKELLRKGTAADLNVYITSLNNGGIIGCAPMLLLATAAACLQYNGSDIAKQLRQSFSRPPGSQKRKRLAEGAGG
jgi:hypothetical protein